MGLWGYFLPFWEIRWRHGCRKGLETVLEAGGGCGTGGFWLQCTPWILSGPAQDSCRPPVAIRDLYFETRLWLAAVLLGKAGPSPQALLVSRRQKEEASREVSL